MHVSEYIPPNPQKIRFFSILLICILVPLNCWWVSTSILRGGGSPTQVSLFYNAIFTILVLYGIGLFLSRLNKLLALNRAELLVLYSCISIGAGLAGVDRFLVLMPLIGHAHWFATPENDWINLFHLHIPSWLVVSNKRALEGYYYGFSSIYESQNLLPWLPKILWWTLFILAVHLVMLCMSLIFRKQWVESERLSYPIIQLPFQLTAPRKQFFKSPWMWLGLGIGASIDIINGLNYLFPAVPSLGGKLFDLRRIFTERPWSGIGWSPIGVFPFGVGLSFFIPLDLSFSCWAFWLIWRAERLLGTIAGWRGLPRFPYEAEQSHGAYLGLCILAIWMSRRYLLSIGQSVFSRNNKFLNGNLKNKSEPVSYTLILISFICGVAFIIGFCLKMGMSLWVVIIYFIIWFAIAIAITRLRAELGSPVHDLHFIGPDEMLPRMVGIRRLGPVNLTGFAYLYFLNRAHRSHAMPHQLEGFKLAEGANIPIKKFAMLMMLASALGAVGSFWVFLSMYYAEGGGPGFGREAFGRLETWLTYAAPPDIPAIMFTSFGFLITLVLAAMRMRFIWWNLHPVGYAISGSWAINPMIGSIFIGWLLKWLVLKYGGIRLHRKAIPFFLGLILGEFFIGSFWSLLAVFLDTPMYRFLF